MSWLSDRPDESRNGVPSPSPYAEAAQMALERLGLQVRAPLRLSSAAYARILPIAESTGYHGALRRAFAEGAARPRDAESQLGWLAGHLCLCRPSAADPWPWWEAAWEAAAATRRLHPPPYLGALARRGLLDELLALPEYPGRLADALVVAFELQARAGARTVRPTA